MKLVIGIYDYSESIASKKILQFFSCISGFDSTWNALFKKLLLVIFHTDILDLVINLLVFISLHK